MSRFATPRPQDMFCDAETPVELATRYDEFHMALNKSLSTPCAPPGSPRAAMARELDENRDFLAKSVSASTIDSVRNALAQADIGKDISTTSPLGTGLVAFDLEAPAKLLAPRPTPVRNRIARHRGQGLAHQFKRILGHSGTGTGGAAGGPIRHGIDESTTNTFGPGNIAYARGPKISYASDEKSLPYIQSGLSDQVSFAAQFAGQSFEDIRQLSSQALLYSTLLSDERMMLGGRGTKTGYAGALPAPTSLVLTKRTAASNEVGASGSIANLFVRVTSLGMWGDSVSSTEATVATVASGQVVDITLVDAVGALGYHVYVGTTTGAANCFAAAVSNSSATLNVAPLTAGSSVPGAPITIHFTGAGTGGAPNTGATTPTTDGSAAVNEFDGILTHLTGSGSGYVKRLNAPLSTGVYANNPGGEFNDAFASLYDAVKSDPDEILANGRDRKAISDLLKTQSSSSYRIMVDNSGEVHDAKIGAVVTGLQNEITGKMVDITVHPWLPQGNMPIISWTLPIPDTNVGDCWAIWGPSDLVQYQWPVTQFVYEASTYQYNTLVSYASAWSGCLQGVFKA